MLMSQKRISLVLSVVLVLFCCSVALAAARRDKLDPGDDLKIGAEAPDFVLKDVEGKTVTLRQFRGNPVVLTFWASWCPACRAELPSLEALHVRMAKQGGVVLGVNGGEPLERVKALMSKLNLTFPMALDMEGKVHALYGIRQYPVTFIIDRYGRLVDRHVGPRDWNSPEVVETLHPLSGGDLEGPR